jgi:ketose-bisphosphate aldolase
MTSRAADWVRGAKGEGWALGQFNMSNTETLQAIVAAAHDRNAPVFIGVSMGTIRHVGLPYIAAMVQVAKASSDVPLLLHLDHGPDLDIVAACIEHGWDSVMIDASALPYAENVALVRATVALAHPRGVAVEAQIGQTWEEDGEGRIEAATGPEEARAFVAATGVDFVAVSIGNTPGQVSGEAPIDVQLLGAIAAVADVPIVMHGGSSVPDAVMREAIGLGVAKVNIDTAIRLAVSDALRAHYALPDASPDSRIPLARGREAARAAIRDKIDLFGSAGRAEAF